MAHQVSPLRFAYDALDPYVDAETMELHHDKHHQTYVDNLNKAIEPYPVVERRRLGRRRPAARERSGREVSRVAMRRSRHAN